VLYKLTPLELKNTKKIARAICVAAKTKSISSRSIHVSNDKLLKKIDKLKLSTRSDAGMFSMILTNVRRKMHHRGIEMIKPGEKNWLEIKEVCNLATEFCNEFGIDKKSGYREYCEIALRKMKNFSLNKFKSLHAPILKTYEALIEIQADKKPQKTERLMKEYFKLVNERIGWTSQKMEPEKQVCFIKAKDEAEKLRLSPEEYVRAQFAELEWTGSMPDPFQLYGEKAIQRAMKYCYKNNIKIGSKESTKIDFKLIKANGKHHSK
jgi:hypothetical protein